MTTNRIIGLIVCVLLLGASLFLLYQRNKLVTSYNTLQTNYNTLDTAKQELDKKLTDAKNSISVLEIENTQLKTQLKEYATETRIRIKRNYAFIEKPQETGKGVTEIWSFTVKEGEAQIVGGWEVDGHDFGAYIVYGPGTYTVKVIDGFKVKVAIENAATELAIRLDEIKYHPEWDYSYLDDKVVKDYEAKQKP